MPHKIRYKIIIKEYNNSKPLTSIYSGQEVSEQYLIDFYGLNNPDVEWYKIEKI